MTKHDYLSGHDWGRIMAHAWKNAAFKKKLESDPTKAVREFAKTAWPDREYKNIFRIHDKPADVTDEQVEKIASGECQAFHCSDLC